MSLPKEPRQLMINLTYLVLTAMLALNVSSEILHAFKIINSSVGKSNDAINGKVNETLLALQANEDLPASHDRIKPFNDKAKLVHAEANKMYSYFQEWKERVIEESGGYEDSSTGEIKREDNIDASTRLLVENRGGDSVKAKLTQFAQFLLSNVSDSVRNSLSRQLPIQIVEPGKSDNNPTGDWATGMFHNMPTLAAVTLFSKLQNDVRNSEALVINQLFKEADAKQIKFDAITAIAVPKQSYLLQGQPVEAEIMLAAYNKSVSPVISGSGGSVTVSEGVGHWKGNANGVGMQTVRGTLTVDLGADKVTRDWSFQYMVGSAGASMQLDKMNVFYIGVPNPITISAAGYSLEDVSVNVPGATVTKTGNGKYDVMVTTPGEVVATINARKQDGGPTTVGSQKVRVKLIPDPEAQVAGKSGGPIAANAAQVQTGVVAELKNFDFQARYVVTSFTFSVVKKRDPDLKGPYKSNGAYFSDDARRLLSGIKPGDRFFIDDIKAVGPDKRVRSLNSLSFVVY